MNILILTETKFGEGHYQAAKAVQEALLSQSTPEPIHVRIQSGLRTAHPLFEWVSAKSYFGLLSVHPQLWGKMYQRSGNLSFFQRYMLYAPLKRFIRRHQIQVVICTHPAAVPALSKIKAEMEHALKWGVIATDYDFHPFAIRPNCDFFVVPSSSCKKKLHTQYGIPTTAILNTGIPIRQPFAKVSGKPLSKKQKQLHVLVLGGSLGIGPIGQVADIFGRYANQFQVTIITGHNKRLYDQLQRISASNIRLLGYVQDMPKWISEADVVLSKPGGLCVTESIACHRPLAILDPIPGQEEANKRFLEEKGLAIPSGPIATLPQRITEWFNDEYRRRLWQKEVQMYARPDAAEKIAKHIVGIIPASHPVSSNYS